MKFKRRNTEFLADLICGAGPRQLSAFPQRCGPTVCSRLVGTPFLI